MAALIPPILLPESPHSNEQRYGLFKVATGPLELEPHGREGGVQYQSALCNVPDPYVIACSPGAKVFNTQLTLTTATPFVVVASLICGTLGHSEAEWAQLVTEKLNAGEQATVESVFSQGLVGQSPSLANNATPATLLTAATNISAGIDALEAWLYATYGPIGTLHIPILANSAVYSDYHILKDTGGIMRTPMGTKVSFGNYANLLPNGSAPTAGHAVFYITGQTAVWRASDAFVSPYGASINKVTNQIQMFAEREFAVGYDCPAAAIEVTLVST